jgi:LysR family glycine cleavage system transcriptional activator
MKTFCIAAKHLSFKKAAEELYMTPSAISHQVKNLEELLCISLFKRQTRSLKLTPIGRQFYNSIQPIITDLESTISMFIDKKENTIITINMPEFFASELFVPRLAEWTKLNDDINLQLETVKFGHSAGMPSDLSIVLSSSLPTAGKVEQLFALKYLPACNQLLYSQWKDRGYEALHSLPLIVHSARPWAWHQWAENLHTVDFNPKQVIQMDSMFSILRAAQQGVGLAMVPMPLSSSWFKEKFLYQLFEEKLITNDRYFLVVHEEAINQCALISFTKWIKKTYQTIG